MDILSEIPESLGCGRMVKLYVLIARLNILLVSSLLLIKIAGMKDLPHTNFSLLKLMQILKMKKGFEQVADKYKVVDIDNLLKIKESINRDEDPKCLILEGIYGSEIIYKEEMQDGDEDINPRMYSLNKGSYLINYLDINLQGSNIYLLRKYNT